jgi:hypothetical protein
VLHLFDQFMSFRTTAPTFGAALVVFRLTNSFEELWAAGISGGHQRP